MVAFPFFGVGLGPFLYPHGDVRAQYPSLMSVQVQEAMYIAGGEP